MIRSHRESSCIPCGTSRSGSCRRSSFHRLGTCMLQPLLFLSLVVGLWASLDWTVTVHQPNRPMVVTRSNLLLFPGLGAVLDWAVTIHQLNRPMVVTLVWRSTVANIAVVVHLSSPSAVELDQLVDLVDRCLQPFRLVPGATDPPLDQLVLALADLRVVLVAQIPVLLLQLVLGHSKLLCTINR